MLSYMYEEEWFEDGDEMRFEDFEYEYRERSKEHSTSVIQAVLYGSVGDFLFAIDQYRHFLSDFAFECSQEIACRYRAKELGLLIERKFDEVISPLSEAIMKKDRAEMESLLDVIAIEAGYTIKERLDDVKYYEGFVRHMFLPPTYEKIA